MNIRVRLSSTRQQMQIEMADALQDAAEALIEQLIQKGKATLAKEQALLDLLTRDGGPNASDDEA